MKEIMDEGEVAVLFRNGNLVTIYKQKGVVYQLVTNVKYLNREDIVWETICAIKED